MISVAIKKRKYARVKGGIASKDHLKIGAAALQMSVLRVIDKIASWCLDRCIDFSVSEVLEVAKVSEAFVL